MCIRDSYWDKFLAAKQNTGGGIKNLDANTAKLVENMADAFAQNFVGMREDVPWAFDRKLNPVRQGEVMYEQGKDVGKFLMARFPGNPQAAIAYLPTFFARMVTAGKDGEYGEAVRQSVADWTSSENAPQQEMALYQAMLRGASETLGLTPKIGGVPQWFRESFGSIPHDKDPNERWYDPRTYSDATRKRIMSRSELGTLNP